MNAFSIGDYENAEKILLPIRHSQPSAEYLLKLIEIQKKGSTKKDGSKNIFMRELLKGDDSKFELLGMVNRASGTVSGLTGAMVLENLKQKANAGNEQAAYTLGVYAQEGIGIGRNFKTAAYYFEKAAQKNKPEALNSMGFYSRYGLGIEKNPQRAKKYYEQAVALNNAYAFYNLAEMYFEGDGIQKDALQAHILADLASLKMDKEKDKLKIRKAIYLKNKAGKELSVLQQAYLKKFLPYSVSTVLPEGYLNGRKYPKRLPFPPSNGKIIVETNFMKRVNTNEDDYKHKVIGPLLPDWVAFPIESQRNVRVLDKTLTAPLIDDPHVLSALYYRPNDPRSIFVTLSAEKMAIPLKIGDILTVYVYSDLFETDLTRKGGRKTWQNTDYQVDMFSETHSLQMNADIFFVPIIRQTAKTQSWVGLSFIARRAGLSDVKFTPRNPDVPEHILRVWVVE